MNPFNLVETQQKPSASCKSCSFVSFCLPAEKTSNLPKPFAPLVKHQYRISKQHTLCHAQQTFKSLYVVKSGILKTSIMEFDGRERIINFYLPGEVLGFEAVDSQLYPFPVESISESIICEVPFKELLASISNQPDLQLQLLRITSRRLKIGDYYNLMGAEQRVAGFLLELAERLNQQDKLLEFTLPMSRQAIGSYLGLATETVIRIINRFHQQGILLAKTKQIKLYNTSKLAWLAQGGQLESFSH